MNGSTKRPNPMNFALAKWNIPNRSNVNFVLPFVASPRGIALSMITVDLVMDFPSLGYFLSRPYSLLSPYVWVPMIFSSASPFAHLLPGIFASPATM